MSSWTQWTVQSIPEESDSSSIMSTDDCYFIINKQLIHYAHIHELDDEFTQTIDDIEVKKSKPTPIHAHVLEHQSEDIFESVQINEIPIQYSSSYQKQTSILTRSFVFDGHANINNETHKSSSFFHLLKKRRHQSELNPLTNNEPILLHLKSLDKQQIFIDLNALEIYYKTQTSTLSSYRKRIRKFFKFEQSKRKVFM